MYTFKEIDKSETVFEQTITHYNQTLNTGSQGLDFIKFVSGSISESYWKSLHVLFYTSGSPILYEPNSAGLDKYDSYGYNFSIYNPTAIVFIFHRNTNITPIRCLIYCAYVFLV